MSKKARMSIGLSYSEQIRKDGSTVYTYDWEEIARSGVIDET